MPVVSAQNFFFGEFLVTQLSGRHPRKSLANIKKRLACEASRVKEQLLSSKNNYSHAEAGFTNFCDCLPEEWSVCAE